MTAAAFVCALIKVKPYVHIGFPLFLLYGQTVQTFKFHKLNVTYVATLLSVLLTEFLFYYSFIYIKLTSRNSASFVSQTIAKKATMIQKANLGLLYIFSLHPTH